jgi:hypothetical protein
MEKKIFAILQQINDKLDNHGQKLDNHGESIQLIHEQLKEHSIILGSLKTSQEAFKAELSESRLQNAKDFGDIKEQIKEIEVSVDLL